MSKILLIEDDGLLTRDLSDKLESRGWEVILAYSYIAAMDRWIENRGEFDCIILDLNVNPHGLSAKKSSDYIPICGMAFLNNIVNGQYVPDNGTVMDIPKLENVEKVIIYSGFIDTLKQRKSEFSYYSQLILIPKSATSFVRLCKKVEEIIKSNKTGSHYGENIIDRR